MQTITLGGQPKKHNASGLVSLVGIHNGVPTTTSLAVACHFNKPHGDVLKRIRALAVEVGERQGYFSPTFTHVVGPNGSVRQEPAFTLNRDGFSLLAMGFTGKKALQFKLDYIDAFNQMERTLLAQANRSQGPEWRQIRQEGKQVRLAWGGCVQEFVAYARTQGSTHADKYFMAITKMEYAALELVKAASDKNFRDSLDCFQHGQLTVVEMAAQKALMQGMAAGLHYKDIYQHCKAACMELAASLRKYLPAAANASHMRLASGVAA
jgi:Rha family phage regulatory protein